MWRREVKLHACFGFYVAIVECASVTHHWSSIKSCYCWDGSDSPSWAAEVARILLDFSCAYILCMSPGLTPLAVW